MPLHWVLHQSKETSSLWTVVDVDFYSLGGSTVLTPLWLTHRQTNRQFLTVIKGFILFLFLHFIFLILQAEMFSFPIKDVAIFLMTQNLLTCNIVYFVTFQTHGTKLWLTSKSFINALHRMRMRSSDENSVYPSVRQTREV